MIKKFFVLIFLSSFSFCEDSLTAQKQNTLYVQNMIDIEEKIAKNFEKYLLTQFKLPTINELSTNEYLGANFSLQNRMGETIAFKDSSKLQIKYAISKSEFISAQDYIALLYNRDLYRDYTTVSYEVKDDKIDSEKSYVEFKLKSQEANTIFTILNEGKSIEKTCSSTLVNTYCNNDSKTIRWYNASSQWIEYNKKDFRTANVTTSMSLASVKTDSEISKLAVGSYIYIQGSSKYVKLINSEILKVD